MNNDEKIRLIKLFKRKAERKAKLERKLAATVADLAIAKVRFPV